MTAQPGFTPDQLDAIWVAYQTQGGAECPNCNGVLELELADHPADAGSGAPAITVRCPSCGQTGTNVPSERHSSEQDTPPI